ncbi:hypothetical protein [Capnocytophaga sp. H2931]|uniref:hypothetical protein n=1 Tax=Capnocytophaga sp. H2931 TaxID=1945657 RepID=UPI000BB1C4AF|nr:hypothetical protein [Capnocytophaga sp. H2931]ATA74802.1 hypothetical protein CGC52_04750 [Capnocytophaga sp. H2931]
MKKRIIIPAILSAVLATGLTSCVKDNESDSVKNLREAKAEELRGSAEHKKAEAEREKAVAAKRLAEAKKVEWEAKVQEHEAAIKEFAVKAAQRSETLAAAGHDDKVKAELMDAEAKRILAQSAVASATAAYEQALAEVAESAAKAVVAAEKAKTALMEQKADAYNEVLAEYYGVLTGIATATVEVSKIEQEILKLEQGVVKAEAVKEKTIAAQKLKVKGLETYIAELTTALGDKDVVTKVEAEKAKAKWEDLKFKAETFTLGREYEDLLEAVVDAEKAFDETKEGTFYNKVQDMIGIIWNVVPAGDPYYYFADTSYFKNLVSLEDAEAIKDDVMGVSTPYVKTPKKLVVNLEESASHGFYRAVYKSREYLVTQAPIAKVEYEKLNGAATVSGSVAEADKIQREKKKDYEDAVRDYGVESTQASTARYTYLNAVEDYRKKYAKREEKRAFYETASEKVDICDKLIDIIANPENTEIVKLKADVETYNKAVKEAAKRWFEEANIEAPVKPAEDVFKALDAIHGKYASFDSTIKQAHIDIANSKAEIEGYNAQFTSKELVEKEKVKLQKTKKLIEALEAKAKALEAKMANLKP